MILVIAPEDDAHDAVLHALSSWSTHALLRPFAWWALEHDESTDHPRHVVRVEHGEVAQATPRDVLDNEHDPLIVVLCNDEGIDTHGAKLLEALEKINDLYAATTAKVPSWWIRWPTFDTDAPDHDGDVTNFTASSPNRAPIINVVRATWRIAPFHISRPATGVDALIDNPNLAPSHAAHVVAATTGLLDAINSQHDTLDRRAQIEALGESPPVHVFSRFIDTHTLIREIHNLAASLPADSPLLQTPILDVDDEFVASVAEQYIARHTDVLSATPPIEPTKAPEPIKGLVAYIQIILSSLGGFIMDTATFFLDRIIGRSYDWVARLLERIGLPVAGLRVERWRPDISDDNNLDDLGTPRINVTDGAVASAWRELCGLICSLGDGGETPAWLKVDVEEQRLPTDALVFYPDLDEPRTESVVGQIITHLQDERSTVLEEQAAAERQAKRALDATSPTERPGTLRRLAARLWRFLKGTGMIVVGIAAFVGLFFLGFIAGATLGFALIIAAPIAGLALAGMGVRTLTRDETEQERINRHETEHHRQQTLADDASGDAARLAARLAEINDWNSVLHAALDTPSVLSPIDRDVTPPPFDLPPAARLANLTAPADTKKHIASRAVSLTLSAPWRYQYLTHMVEVCEQRARLSFGLQPDDNRSSPFNDRTGPDRTGVRSDLIRYLESESGQADRLAFFDHLLDDRISEQIALRRHELHVTAHGARHDEDTFFTEIDVANFDTARHGIFTQLRVANSSPDRHITVYYGPTT